MHGHTYLTQLPVGHTLSNANELRALQLMKGCIVTEQILQAELSTLDNRQHFKQCEEQLD